MFTNNVLGRGKNNIKVSLIPLQNRLRKQWSYFGFTNNNNSWTDCFWHRNSQALRSLDRTLFYTPGKCPRAFNCPSIMVLLILLIMNDKNGNCGAFWPFMHIFWFILAHAIRDAVSSLSKDGVNFLIYMDEIQLKCKVLCPFALQGNHVKWQWTDGSTFGNTFWTPNQPLVPEYSIHNNLFA